MPSSITVTVSHLPTSTSFFLSALQPLDYAYRCRSTNNTIGFGSTTDPSASPDFWIAEEIPGVPAGAVHVAFPAPSRFAVQQFFIAALKAGGKVHGEPAVRDAKGCYYSAAVIDFDGNSIEAVFRPGALSTASGNGARSAVSASSRTPTSTAQGAESQISKATAGVDGSANALLPEQSAADVARTLVQSVTGPSSVQTRVAQTVQPDPRHDNHCNTMNNAQSGIVGALLGVATGAALHYAFTHDRHDRGNRGHVVPATVSRSPEKSFAVLSGRQLQSTPKSGHYSTMKDNHGQTQSLSDVTIQERNRSGVQGDASAGSRAGSIRGSTNLRKIDSDVMHSSGSSMAKSRVTSAGEPKAETVTILTRSTTASGRKSKAEFADADGRGEKSSGSTTTITSRKSASKSKSPLTQLSEQAGRSAPGSSKVVKPKSTLSTTSSSATVLPIRDQAVSPPQESSRTSTGASQGGRRDNHRCKPTSSSISRSSSQSKNTSSPVPPRSSSSVHYKPSSKISAATTTRVHHKIPKQSSSSSSPTNRAGTPRVLSLAETDRREERKEAKAAAADLELKPEDSVSQVG